MKKRPLIMIVDDDKDILKMLKRALELEGWCVAIANNGKSALDMMEKLKTDLIILDLVMPELDGFQVLNLVRERSDVPVIILTAIEEVTSIYHSLLVAADDLVRKPFPIRELVTKIKTNLRFAGQEST